MQKKGKKNPPKKREKKKKEKESNKLFCVGKICIECKWDYQIYSMRLEIKRVKIKGRGRDQGRMTLRLRVVEKWKGGKKVRENAIVRYK